MRKSYILKLFLVLFLILTSFNSFALTKTINADNTISGHIDWFDGENDKNTRPDSVIVKLFADGNPALDQDNVPITITVTEENNWKYTFKNIPEQGNDEIIYTIDIDKIDGYDTAYYGFNITNTLSQVIFDIKGKKIWNDYDNEDGLRPESVTIHLNRNGGWINSVDVSEDDNWEYEFTGLLKYDEYGKDYVYHVYEIDDDLHYLTYTDKYDVHNAQIFKQKDIKIKKVDSEGNPIPNTTFDIYEYLTIGALEYRPVEKAEDVSTRTNYLNPNKYSYWQKGGFSFGFFTTGITSPMNSAVYRKYPHFAKHAYSARYCIYTPLLKFKDGTTLLEFLDKYERFPSDEEYSLDDIDYENTEWQLVETTEFFYSNSSAFEDGYMFSTIGDYEDVGYFQTEGKPEDRPILDVPYAILDGDDQIYLDDLPEETILKIRKMVDKRHLGQIEIYKNPSSGDNDMYVKHKIGEFTTDDKGEIILEDLYCSHKITTVIYNNSNLLYTLHELINPNLIIVEKQTASDKYILDPSEYTIDISKEDEIVITNKYVTTDITINKKWIDNDDKDKSRPDSIEVNVLANDEVVETITLSKDEDYSYTLENMPKYKKDELIKYSIEEIDIPDNYEVSYEIDQENYSFTITNTYHKQKPEPKPTPKPSYDIPKTGVE